MDWPAPNSALLTDDDSKPDTQNMVPRIPFFTIKIAQQEPIGQAILHSTSCATTVVPDGTFHSSTFNTTHVISSPCGVSPANAFTAPIR